MRRRALIAVGACLVLTASACTGRAGTGRSETSATADSTTPSSAGVAAPATTPEARPTRIPIALDRRVADDATEGFEAVTRATLSDPRGWQAAGFEFVFAPDATFTIVLAEGDLVDQLCQPYDVGGRYSCQLGPVVALNADRWREATPQWTGDLHTYRQMLVNHEVGHLLGQHHPRRQCPAVGESAPVMAQQSTELRGCLPNPWPLPWEIACAAQHTEPIAPGYEPDAEPSCGPEG